MIEVLSVGEEALARRAEINERFADALAETHAQALAEGAELGPVPRWALRAAAGAAWELTVEHLRTRGVEGLTELAPQIEQVQLALLRGDYAGDAEWRAQPRAATLRSICAARRRFRHFAADSSHNTVIAPLVD